MYRCEAASPEGFVQQLAVSYLRNGYWFYVTGYVPEPKDPKAVDRKLVARYDIDLSKWARARKKRAGAANLQYLRFDRFFVLLATHGEHAFFRDEASSIRDARRVPIRFRGYAVSHRGGHPHVRIEENVYRGLKAHLLDRATHRSAEWLSAEFRSLQFEPYAPVRRQLLAVYRAVNRERKQAGFSEVPKTCLRLRRLPCLPFQGRSPEDVGRPPG